MPRRWTPAAAARRSLAVPRADGIAALAAFTTTRYREVGTAVGVRPRRGRRNCRRIGG